ncbi:hypothetical protein F5Y15DRAFT_415353 [Xylariaceae sp. FL0016]|nr:hypothetical protein F5Y15DRAFT_415353 [Xylariaceae sp. FL0016]
MAFSSDLNFLLSIIGALFLSAATMANASPTSIITPSGDVLLARDISSEHVAWIILGCVICALPFLIVDARWADETNVLPRI